MSSAVSADEVLWEVVRPFPGVLFGAIAEPSDTIKWGAVVRLAMGDDAVYGVLHIRFGLSGPWWTGTSLSGSMETGGVVRREAGAVSAGVVPICGELAVGVDLSEVETSGVGGVRRLCHSVYGYCIQETVALNRDSVTVRRRLYDPIGTCRFREEFPVAILVLERRRGKSGGLSRKTSCPTSKEGNVRTALSNFLLYCAWAYVNLVPARKRIFRTRCRVIRFICADVGSIPFRDGMALEGAWSDIPGGCRVKMRLQGVVPVELWTCIFYAYVRGCT